MTDTLLSTSSQVNGRYASRSATRNTRILAFAKRKGRKWSYGLIADHFGVSRNIVAGLLFRDRHPPSERIPSPGSKGGNKTGTGRKSAPYWPEKYKPTHPEK